MSIFSVRRYPHSEIIKVGKSTAYDVYHRRINAQTYFFNEVICLGIQFCDSKKDALALEKAILAYFSPDTQDIRKNCELVADVDSALRLYITCCCSQPQEFFEAAEVEWKQRRKAKKQMNKLRFGDNLQIKRETDAESVDLICTDRPSTAGKTQIA